MSFGFGDDYREICNWRRDNIMQIDTIIIEERVRFRNFLLPRLVEMLPENATDRIK